ncbi:MAG TPA: hypothetical protein VGP93_11385, partial [Polyangiaceae bacterium]|nr:hypothetical protein [Polyangiaceae bacterium]
DGQALLLLNALPAAQSASVAQKLAEPARLGSLSAKRLRELEHWLHARVAQRVPGFRTVYDALAGLEERLSSLKS